MEESAKNAHPFIKLLIAYLVFFCFSALLSVVLTPAIPGVYTPLLGFIVYSMFIVPCGGVAYSIYLAIKEKDSSNRIFMIALLIVQLLFFGWYLIMLCFFSN